MNLNLGTIFASLKIYDEMSPALKSAGYQLVNFGQGMSRAGAVASGYSAAVTVMATNVIQLGVAFEKTTTQLVALAGVTKSELEGVRQSILELAPAVGIGPQALSEAMYVVSSTLDKTSVALEVLEVAAMGSAIGMGATKDVAKALVAIINSYGAENISAAKAGDILTRVIRDGGAEAAELAPRLAKVIPFAAQLGISFEEVGANIATLTKLGVPASQAVTSLASVFAALARAVPRGQKALAEVGMTYAGLRAEIKEKGLTETLIRLRETFKDNEEGLIDVVGRLEALKDVLGTTGPMAEVYRKVMERTAKAQGELKGSFDIAKETAAFQWAQLQASLDSLWISLSMNLMPAFKGFISFLQNSVLPIIKAAIDAFTWLWSPIQSVIMGMIALTAVVVPLIIVMGQLVMALGFITRGSDLFRKSSTSLITAIAEVSEAERIATQVLRIKTAAQTAAKALTDADTASKTANTLATTANTAAIEASAKLATLRATTPQKFQDPVTGRFGGAAGLQSAIIKAETESLNANKVATDANNAARSAATVLTNANVTAVGAAANANKILAAETRVAAAATGFLAGAFNVLKVAMMSIAVIAAITVIIGAIQAVVSTFTESVDLNTEASNKNANAHMEEYAALQGLEKEISANVFASTDLEGIKKKLINLAPEYRNALMMEKGNFVDVENAIKNLTEAKKAMLAQDMITLQLNRSVIEAKQLEAAAVQKAAEAALEAARNRKTEWLDAEIPVGSFRKSVAATQPELAKLGQALLDARLASEALRKSFKDNEATISSLDEILNENVRITNESTRASGLQKIALSDLANGDTSERIANGLALWTKGMQLAGKSQKDLDEALKNSGKMKIFIADVNRALNEETVKGTQITKDQQKAIDNLKEALREIDQVEKAAIRTALAKYTENGRLKASISDIAKVYKLNEDAIKRVITEDEEMAKVTKNAWDSIIKVWKTAAAAREKDDEKFVKDSATARDRIEVMNSETAANLIAISGVVRDAKIADVDTWVVKEQNTLDRLKLGFWGYLDYSLSMLKKSASEKDFIRDKDTKAHAQSVLALTAIETSGLANIQSLRDKYEVTRLARQGNNLALRKAKIEKSYSDEVAIIEVALAKEIVQIIRMKNVTGAEIDAAIAKAKIRAKDMIAVLGQIRTQELVNLGLTVTEVFGKISTALGMFTGRAGEVAGKIQGIISSATQMGATFGPVGAVVGAVTGIFNALSGASKASTKAADDFYLAWRKLMDGLIASYGFDRLPALFAAVGIAFNVFKETIEQTEARFARFEAAIKKLKDEMDEIASSLRMASAELIAFRNAVPTDPLVMTFVLQQVQAAGSSVQSMLGNMQSSATAIATKKIREEIAILQEQIRVAEAAGRGSSSDNDITGDWRTRLKLLEEMRDATIGAIKITKGGAMAMAAILIASYDGTAASLRAMAPALATLQAAMKASGIEGSAAFNSILALSKLATDEITGPMIDAINNGAAALVAMYNSGFLTQEVFSGMLGEIQAQRQALLDNGATLEQVNQIMAPSLQKIWELWKTGKYKVDDVTRAQLEAAQAAGTVGDKHRSATDRMVLALERLADMFETVFADKLEDAAKRGAAAAQAAIDGIKGRVVRVDVEYNWPGQTGGPGGGGTGSGGGQGGGGNTPPGFAGGTRGRYIDFGSGTNAVLHGRERIMTEEEGRAANRGDQTIEVSMGEEVIIRKVVRGMPRVMRLKGYM